MTTAVSNVERSGEANTLVSEMAQSVEKTNAFDMLLGSVLNDTERDSSGRDGAMRDTPENKNAPTRWAAKETPSASADEQVGRIDPSAVSLYVYDAEQTPSYSEIYAGNGNRSDSGTNPSQERADARAEETTDESLKNEAENVSAKKETEETGEADAQQESDTEPADGETQEPAEQDGVEQDAPSEEEAANGAVESGEEGGELEEAAVVEGEAAAEESGETGEEMNGEEMEPVAESGTAAVEDETEEDATSTDESGEESDIVEEQAGMSGEPAFSAGEQGTSGNRGDSEESSLAAEMTTRGMAVHGAGNSASASGFQAAMMQQAAASAGSASGLEAVARAEQIQQLVDRFDQHILSMIRQSSQDLTITISPESLGRLVVHCREEGDGVRVQVEAENASVCNLLQQQESGIRTALNQNGYRLSEFEVSTGNGDSAEQRKERAMNNREDETAQEGNSGKPAGTPGREQNMERVEHRIDRNGVWLVA